MEFIKRIKKVGLNFFTSGSFDSLDAEEKRRIVFLNSLTLLGICLLLFFGFRAVFEGNYYLAAATLSTTGIVIISFVHLRITRTTFISKFVITSMMFLLYAFLVFSGGTDNSGFLWIYSFPLISVFLLGFRIGAYYAFSLCFLSVYIYFFSSTANLSLSLSYKLRIIGVYILVLLCSLLYEWARKSTQNTLESTSKELLNEKKQTDSILDNVSEGIFLIDSKYIIGEKYSIILEDFLDDTNLGGRSFIDILRYKISEKDLNSLSDYFDMIFSGTIDKDLLKQINPLDRIEINLERDEKGFVIEYLNFQFALIETERGKEVLGTVRNITEEVILGKKLKEEENKSRRQMENLFQIIHVDPDLIYEFIIDTEDEMGSINAMLKSDEKNYNVVLKSIYQSIHSIKGNALLLGLNRLSKKLHLIEDKIKELLESDCTWTELLSLTLDLSEIQTALDDIRFLIEKIKNFQHGFDKKEKKDLLINTISKSLEKESKLAGKEIEFNAEKFDSSLIDIKHRKILKNIFVHMARNAVAHGIESPEVRASKNKKSKGLVSLENYIENDNLHIVFRDDGQAFDFDKILEKAKAHEKLSKLKLDSLDKKSLLKLIFHPGFSTSENEDMSSGRGIGMAYIKTSLSKIGGSLGLKYVRDKYCEFHIKTPIN